MVDVKKTNEELERMKASLNGVVDINYKRYNNKYMQVAGEHMKGMKEEKTKRSDSKLLDASEEASEILFNKFRGRSIL